jgi:hypothetical protein
MGYICVLKVSHSYCALDFNEVWSHPEDAQCIYLALEFRQLQARECEMREPGLFQQYDRTQLGGMA